MRDYQMGEHKNPSRTFNIPPTTLQSKVFTSVNDYRLK